MSGLAMIYKKHLNDADVPQATKKAVTWIKDKILHGYYMTGMEDRYVAFFEKSAHISFLSGRHADYTSDVNLMF